MSIDAPWGRRRVPSATWLVDLLGERVPPMVAVSHVGLARALKAAGSARGPAELVVRAISVGIRISSNGPYENAVEAGFAAACASSWIGRVEERVGLADPARLQQWREWCVSAAGGGSGSGSGGAPAWVRRQVGIITPYRKQATLVRRVLVAVMGPQRALCVDVSTVDGFQGQERNRIVISCVR